MHPLATKLAARYLQASVDSSRSVGKSVIVVYKGDPNLSVKEFGRLVSEELSELRLKGAIHDVAVIARQVRDLRGSGSGSAEARAEEVKTLLGDMPASATQAAKALSALAKGLKGLKLSPKEPDTQTVKFEGKAVAFKAFVAAAVKRVEELAADFTALAKKPETLAADFDAASSEAERLDEVFWDLDARPV